EQEAPARMPERSFGEETTAGGLLERDIRADDLAQAGISNLEARHAVRSTYSASSRKFGSGGEERSTGARAMLGAAPLDPAADQTEQDAARHDHDRRAEQRETEPRQVFHSLEESRGVPRPAGPRLRDGLRRAPHTLHGTPRG